MDLLEFAKKFTTFKPPPYQEALFKMIEEAAEKGEDTACISINSSHRWYKDLRFNEFLYSHLTKMVEGQTFALASLKGIHIFKMIKFESYQSKETREDNLTQHTTTEGETTDG